MKRMTKKITVLGVESIPTRDMFRDLKRRGFQSSLEKGSNGTFKILSFINGVTFVISCVDGRDPVYCKDINRSARDWKLFKHIDELLTISMVNGLSMPTEKQTLYFNSLQKSLNLKKNQNVTMTSEPSNVMEMMEAITETKHVITLLRSKYYEEYKGIYIECQAVENEKVISVNTDVEKEKVISLAVENEVISKCEMH